MTAHSPAERAICHIKNWKFLTSDIRIEQLDIIGMAFRCVAGIVDFSVPPICSREDAHASDSDVDMECDWEHEQHEECEENVEVEDDGSENQEHQDHEEFGEYEE